MKVIAITTDFFFEGEHSGICALLDAGLDFLHVRKPSATCDMLREWIALIPERFHDRLVLHDGFDLVRYFSVGGLHVNRRNPNFPEVWNGRRSCSCHSLDEAAAACRVMDYCFLSPIFDSISKCGYTGSFDLGVLKSSFSGGILGSNVFALGGVSSERLPLIKEIGFGGYAVLGALWGDFVLDGDVALLLERFYSLCGK